MLLKIFIEEECRERMLGAVVTLQPDIVGLRIEPEWEIDRKMAVDAGTLKGSYRFEGAIDFRAIDFAAVVKHGTMKADQINAAFGEHSRGLAQVCRIAI